MPGAEEVNLSHAFGLAPKDAIAYFEAKGFKISWNWWETWQASHARSFTVAKAAQMDVLEAIREELDLALKNGTTRHDFIKTLEPKLKALGWWGKQVSVGSDGQDIVDQLGSPWRLKNIYRTNLQTAYMSGRYKAQMENSDQRPYWMYVAVIDKKTRKSHESLNGKVFHYTDPIWKTHYPPNGWGCRCRVRALSERALSRKGLKAESSGDRLETKEVDAGVDPATGEVITKPVTTYTQPDGSVLTPDAGWNHNVGEAAFGTDIEVMRKISLVKDDGIRAQTVQALNNSPERHKVFAAWTDAVRQRGRLNDQMKQKGLSPEQKAAIAQQLRQHTVDKAQTLGFVSESVARYVESKGLKPARVLVMSEHGLLHSDSPRHRNDGVALTPEEYRRLPEMLASPEAVLWDKTHDNLLYVFPAEGEHQRQIKIVVNAPDGIKKIRSKLDVVINAFKVPIENLQQAGMYEVIEGRVSIKE